MKLEMYVQSKKKYFTRKETAIDDDTRRRYNSGEDEINDF